MKNAQDFSVDAFARGNIHKLIMERFEEAAGDGLGVA